jgi:hypothetical protein
MLSLELTAFASSTKTGSGVTLLVWTFHGLDQDKARNAVEQFVQDASDTNAVVYVVLEYSPYPKGLLNELKPTGFAYHDGRWELRSDYLDFLR